MIELFQFQQEASARISERFVAYLDDPVVTGKAKSLRRIPFFQALSSLTASGKTIMLADATAEIAAALPVAPVVLWLSKGTVVVEQALANLLPGGKYAHLIGNAEVRALAEYSVSEVDESQVPLIYFATVGTFNQKDKEAGDRLIFRSEIDTAEESTWEALKKREDGNGQRRPLLVVYDEAHNISDQQTDLLMELEPDGFLLASATMRLPQRLADVVEELKRNGLTDGDLITAVNPLHVADAGLVKSTVVLGGYRAPMEETIDALLKDMAEGRADASRLNLAGRPKAIYVCNTNMVATDSYRRDDPKRPFNEREAPPILIWRYLTEAHGVDPSKIATYARLAFDKAHPKPNEFVLFAGGDKDYSNFVAGDFEHIIFNLSLQEGWDDPMVYFAYVDRSMESKVAIEQVVGRVLRQPGAKHFAADRLNTAHFYVRVDRNEVFNDVLEEVSARLSVEAPTIKLIKAPPGKKPPIRYEPKVTVQVPATAYDSSQTIKSIEGIINSLSDYRNDDGTNTRGQGSRRISHQKVGVEASSTSEWQQFEQANQVSARWIFQREVKSQFSRALEVASTASERFDARVGLGSAAYEHITDVARKVVASYVKNVLLVQRKVDPYVVGPILVQEEDAVPYDNAVHEGYDGLNPFEKEFAQAIDKTGVQWSRNPPVSGYGIPLISLGATKVFYPDFLIWHNGDVLAVDTKGAHLLLEAAGRKLLNIRPHKEVQTRLLVRFVTKGEFNEQVQQLSTIGYTLWSRREDGTLRAEHHSDIQGVVEALLV